MKKAITVATLLLLSGAASAQEGYSAKSLFFGEDGSVVAASTDKKPVPAASAPVLAKNEAKPKQKKSLAPRQIGASYFIRLKGEDGSTRDVLANRTFRSGDRFQLGVKVNRPSYVYVLNQDPDGNLAQIFPVAGQDNYVNAMGTVFLPARGAFEFDAKPGAEQLLVFLSPTPMNGGVNELVGRTQPDLDAGLVAGATCNGGAERMASAPATLDGPAFASKAITFKEDSGATCGAARPAYASKAVVFSDDPEPGQGGQVASYVVKKPGAKSDKNLFLKIKLAHE
jgi:hypothetical protein